MRNWALTLTLTVSALPMFTCLAQTNQRPVDFQRDIRPILSDKCFTCHGPDEKQRASELRLDLRQSVFEKRDGMVAVVPGDTATSELIARVISTDVKRRMPPPESQRELSESEVELLKRWVAEGATWNDHWSFKPIHQPPPPTTKIEGWSDNPIDAFVAERLQAEGLQPSVSAARHTLLRRLYLDLTGLPPSVADVDAFAADASPNAYQRVVDRLLASPRYGEQMAVGWLDAARYADTSGYQNDGPRFMWRWRDWVIDAFNRNLPFDQFTIEQIAGDLLNRPTLDQLIATGFNRNHRGNAEGGIIPEEYQVEYVVDRVDTTSTVWLGLTMGCARCHDHKYDPIGQKEYYQVFAYFNNLPESGRAIKEGNSPPYVKAPRNEEQYQLDSLDEQIASTRLRLERLQPKLRDSQLVWEQSFSTQHDIDWTVNDGLVSHLPFSDSVVDEVRETKATIPNNANFVPGVKGKAIELDGKSSIDNGSVAGFGYFDPFSIACWLHSDGTDGTLISKMTPVEEGTGYFVGLRHGRLQVNLIKRWLDDAIRIETRDPIPANQWCHLVVVYDGTRLAGGIRVYLNGVAVPMNINLDRLNQTFALPTEPLRIGGGERNLKAKIDEMRVYARDLSDSEVELLAEKSSVNEILSRPVSERTESQARKLTRYFIDNYATDEIREADHHLTDLLRQRRALYESIPTVMVMQEMAQPRATHVLVRGQYDHPGDAVRPGVPSALPPLPVGLNDSTKANRLGFAKWLVSSDQPLTPRVIMNRLWQHHFGMGLVRTAEDFGAQGDLPSHPELLDWLAAEFIRSGWDIKAMQRLIVCSATYRQGSSVTAELQQLDPENRLLARGPRRRLAAETIRDQALFAAGLLPSEIGGPSVKPYQPNGLWQEIATDTDYQQSHGANLYRRSLYTYWKRTVAPPTMVTMDATAREACVVKRSSTNTPLQALAVMNDTTFVEAARVLAQRLIAEFPSQQRISQAFKVLTAREPKATELAILNRRFEQTLQVFQQEPAAARKLIEVGEYPAKLHTVGETELAALTTIVSLMLNLDEVVASP
jgi:Protein of unknown function (DUF1553)/Protein of unknown function (DUF1549)/Concanavalin A-like lectin/glucanases superfamily/Planctomycete cytochrome C